MGSGELVRISDEQVELGEWLFAPDVAGRSYLLRFVGTNGDKKVAEALRARATAEGYIGTGVTPKELEDLRRIYNTNKRPKITPKQWVSGVPGIPLLDNRPYDI